MLFSSWTEETNFIGSSENYKEHYKLLETSIKGVQNKFQSDAEG